MKQHTGKHITDVNENNGSENISPNTHKVKPITPPHDLVFSLVVVFENVLAAWFCNCPNMYLLVGAFESYFEGVSLTTVILTPGACGR